MGEGKDHVTSHCQCFHIHNFMFYFYVLIIHNTNLSCKYHLRSCKNIESLYCSVTARHCCMLGHGPPPWPPFGKKSVLAMHYEKIGKHGLVPPLCAKDVIDFGVGLNTEKDRKGPKRTEKGPKRTEKDRKGPKSTQ